MITYPKLTWLMELAFNALTDKQLKNILNCLSCGYKLLCKQHAFRYYSRIWRGADPAVMACIGDKLAKDGKPNIVFNDYVTYDDLLMRMGRGIVVKAFGGDLTKAADEFNVPFYTPDALYVYILSRISEQDLKLVITRISENRGLNKL